MPKENDNNATPITQSASGGDALKGELDAAKAATPQAVELAKLPLKERIATLEADLDSKNKDVEVLKSKLSEGEKGFASLTASFEGAVSAYKGAALKANPLLPPELITGASIAEVDASVEKASAIVGKIKEGIAQQTQQLTIPPGAPGRTPPDTSTMTTREKITHGIQNARKKGG